MRKNRLISAILSISLLSTMMNFTVLAEERSTDETRIIYSENFDAKEDTDGLFTRETNSSFLNNPQYLTSEYELNTGISGRDNTDKSLHLKETFKCEYGKDNDGNALTEEKLNRFNRDVNGNGGVHHKVNMTDQTAMSGDEKYIHISFSALQDKVPDTIGQDMGAALDVAFNLNTKSGDRSRVFLCWQSNERQSYGWGNDIASYQVPEYAGKWVKYDYVFNLTNENRVVDTYINGYKTLSRNWIWDSPEIQGIKQIDFQLRDVNTGDATRDVNVYLDDIKVSYDKTAPVITTYSTFGEAARLDNVPEQYVNSETGIVYNYGQTLTDMAGYINGESEDTKNVYLVTEKSGNVIANRTAVFDFEKYASESLNIIKLNDGREVNPILFVEDGGFTYRYEVRQPLATTIKPVDSSVTDNSVSFSWTGQSANCTGIEIFRDGTRIAQLAADETSYTDEGPDAGAEHTYQLREILTNHDVSEFIRPLSVISIPENFKAVQIAKKLAVKLTWEKPSVGTPTGYKIYRDGTELIELGTDVYQYTDSADMAEGVTHSYYITAVSGNDESDKTAEVSVTVSLSDSDNRVIYSENFDKYDSWNDSAIANARFAEKLFYKDLSDYTKTEYELQSGAYSRAAEDKSLHINTKFSNQYGAMPDGSALGAWTDDRDCYVDSTNGVHNRVMADSNTTAMNDSERYLHIAFSAAQDPATPDSVSGEKSAGLNVTFEFMADKANSGDNDKEFELLHWYNQGYRGTLNVTYQVPMSAGKWVNYDYVFDKTANTLDIYMNGYLVVQGMDLSVKFNKVYGVKRLNFQVRDMNTSNTRDIDVYLDDIKVEYCEENPRVSPYSTFGDAAMISGASEMYVDSETGIIYNNGQSLSDMKSYIQDKNVYLMAEAASSTTNRIQVEKYSSNSLDAIKLTDGRTVSPILCVEDGDFTYYYEIKQPEKTNIKLDVIDVAQDSITLGWNEKSDNCESIEVFRDGKKLAEVDSSVQSYEDKDVVQGQIYEYSVREVLEDGNKTKFSAVRSSFISSIGRPENYTAVSVSNQLAVKLTWEAPRYGTVTGYEIYRNGTLLTEVGADVHEYTDSSNLKAGNEYAYSVVAVGENSDKSDKTSEISIVADIISPPQNVSATDDEGNVKISWNAVEGAVGYEIYRNGTLAAKTSDCSYVITDCADDTFYEFYVKAVNELEQQSRNSETVKYVKHNAKLAVFSNIFDDTLGDGWSYMRTNGAEIESGAEYSAIGTSGVCIGFNSNNFNGQSAGFAAANALNLSKIKDSSAEIRFMMYVPKDFDISKLDFGVAQTYSGETKLEAKVEIENYVKNTGWNFVRIPLKDLPAKGTYISGYKTYESKFDYAKVTEIGFFSDIRGLAKNACIMVDEMTILSNQPPEVLSVKANGALLENGDVISGQTNQFSVKFDSKMDNSRMSSDTMMVVCENKKVPSIVEYNEKTDEYVIYLLDNLAANKEYSVVVEKTLSEGGVTQTEKYSLEFTTDSAINTGKIVKNTDLNLKSVSGKTNEVIEQNLEFSGGAANETVCGFDIEISYDGSLLQLFKGDVQIADALKDSGITVTSDVGRLRISRTVDKLNNISLKDGIGTFAIGLLKNGSSQISATGKLYCYYSDTDTVKEIEVNGSATITATSGSSGSNVGIGGSSGGGNRPTIGETQIPTTPTFPNELPTDKTTFSDISSVEWARDGILYLSEHNIINGYGDSTFRPDNAITREEFVTIIVKAFGMETENVDCDFSDVNPSDWYYGYVSAAVNAGVVAGMGGNIFGAGKTISRQDMCVIINRIIESQNLLIDEEYSKLEFTDDNQIADYAKEAVSKLQQMGIVNGMGDNMFIPQGDVTRAMAAKVMYQMLQGENSPIEKSDIKITAASRGALKEAERLEKLGFLDADEIDTNQEQMSKAAFVKTAIRMYLSNNPASSYDKVDFKDVVPGEFAANEIQLALDTGLIEKADNFYPTNPISYDEAIKIIVKVLGYDAFAESKGYIGAAADADVLKGVNSKFELKDALKLLDNALDSYIVINTSTGSSIDKDRTLLTQAGIVKEKADIVNVDIWNNIIEIDNGMSYATENIDLGVIPEGRANIYMRNSDDVVIYIDVLGDTKVVYDFIEYINKDQSKQDIYPSGIKKMSLRNTGETFVVDEDAKITLNENAVAGKYINSFAKVIIKDKEIVKVDAYSLRTGGLIYRADKNEIKYVSDEMNENVISGFEDLPELEIYIDGVRSSNILDLKANMVFDYWCNEDESRFIIVASSRSVKGKMERSSSSSIYVDGTEFEMSEDNPLIVQSYVSKKYSAQEDYKNLMGKNVEIYIDDNKYARFIKSDEALSEMNEFYGVVLGAWTTDSGEDHEVRVHKITGNAGEAVYKLASKLKAGSLNVDDMASVAKNYDGMGFLKFTLNSKGEITKAEIPENWGYKRTVNKFEKNAVITGMSFKKATMFALMEIDGQFTVKHITFNNIEETRVVGGEVTMVSDFNLRDNPVPRFIALTTNSDKLCNSYTKIAMLESTDTIVDDNDEIKVRLNFTGGQSYMATPEFVEKHGLNKRCLVRFYDKMIGEDPFYVASVYDLSGDPENWQTDTYSPGKNQAFFKMDSIRYRDEDIIQFEIAGEPTETFMVHEGATIYEYNPRTGKCERRALEDIKKGDPCWCYIVDWEPKGVEKLYYISSGMTPSNND